MGKEAEGDSIQAVVFLAFLGGVCLGDFFLRVLPDPYKCEH